MYYNSTGSINDLVKGYGYEYNEFRDIVKSYTKSESNGIILGITTDEEKLSRIFNGKHYLINLDLLFFER